ncbi:MAG TPA: hypothetical protein VGG39_20570 [Polyangiaceae bacterium]|jgi:hypothetical protein
MRALPRTALLLAGLNVAAVSIPSAAWAQGRPAPVPYPTAPVPAPAPPPPVPTASGPARPAGDVGADVVFLKNGGVLRGTVVDAIPDSQVRIQLATGEIATIPWGAMARLEYGKASGGQPPPPPPPPPAGGPAGTVVLHVEGADDAEVEMRPHDEGTWTTVCSGRCDRALPVGAAYRIAGGGMRPSKAFHLDGSAGRVNVTVNPASTGWFVAGIVLVPVGGATMLIGGLIGLLGDATGDQSASSSGGVAFLVGLAGLVGGIVLIVSNARSGVSLEVGAAQAALAQGDAWRRVPVWREPGPESRALPRAAMMPLWTGSF